MQEVQIDWLAVVIAAVLNVAIGYFWYSKWLFGKTWLHLSKRTEKEMRQDKIVYLYTFFISLVIAFFLALFEAYLGITTVSDGMYVGFCVWLGFVATTQIASVLWTKKPVKLFVLNTCCKLLSFLVMGGVIGA